MATQLDQFATPSFLRSMWEGIKGYFKGGIAGALIGAVIIGGIGLTIGYFASPETVINLVKGVFGNGAESLITSIAGKVAGTSAGTAAAASANFAASTLAGVPVTLAVPVMSHTAGAALAGLSGAAIGAGAFGALGALGGSAAKFVESRQAGQPSAADVVNVAKLSFAQGQMAGEQKVVQHLMAAQAAEKGTKWQDKITNEQAAKGIAQANTVH